MFILTFLLIFIIFNFINLYCVNHKLLIDNSFKSNHKKLVNRLDVPVTGGILIVFSLIFLVKEISLINKFFFFNNIFIRNFV